jgi:CHRD domain
MPVTNKLRRRKRPKGGVATLKPRRLLATVVLTMLAAAVVIALPATAAPQPLATLRANLTGAQEVPGPGDPDGLGHAMVKVYKAKVCYTLSVRGIKPAIAAHIHKGPKGVAGPIVVPTDQSSLKLPRPTSSGCEAIPSSLSMKLRQNPSNYYVNVHNTPYPEGAIRGQLRMMKGM